MNIHAENVSSRLISRNVSGPAARSKRHDKSELCNDQDEKNLAIIELDVRSGLISVFQQIRQEFIRVGEIFYGSL